MKVSPCSLLSLTSPSVATPEAFVKSFQWNVLKYRTDYTVGEVAETLIKEAQQIDNLIKARMATYNQAKSAVTAVERKNAGTLITKDLGDYLTKDDFVQSEMMATLLVIVHKINKNKWESNYERLSEMVVPRSSRFIVEEGDHSLYTVTVFNKVKDEFVKNASSEGFVIREYVYDAERITLSKETNVAMQSDLKAQWNSLVRLLKTNFGELFSAWVHLKVLRLFVESVLHYGLPPFFLALILKPIGKDSRADKKLRIALLQHLEQLQLPGISAIDIATALHTTDAGTIESVEEAELWTALNISTRDHEPFVKIPLKLPLNF